MTFQDGYIRWIRQHIGHELIYLVYTSILVFNEAQELLVIERPDFSWLGVPGGALELGESISACAHREVLEETGVHAEITGFLGVFSHPQYELHYPNGDRVQPWTVGLVAKTTDQVGALDQKEITKASFRPIDEVYSQLFIQYQHMIDAYRSPRGYAIEEVFSLPTVQPYFPLLREKVGHAPLILPGTSMVVYDDKGYALAVRKKGTRRWRFPAGFSDIGESSSATAVREMKEETGLDIEPVDVIGIYSDPTVTQKKIPNGDQFQIVDYVLECQVIGGELRIDDNEIDGIQYMALDDLLAQPDNSTHFQRILLDVINRHNRPFIR
ncbi:MAG: hypothetical protein CUN55_01880 [Phototrophicales bacterium]|nr:MAG: hypothetical protein CUN55_01880 [Phototrophicales bacterium]